MTNEEIIEVDFELEDFPEIDVEITLNVYPDKLSQLENDTGFQTEAEVESLVEGSAAPIIQDVENLQTDFGNISDTINSYGDIVSHNASEFATAQQGTKADTALQSIDSSDVTTALGYIPYANTNPDGYITGINSSDVTTALGYTPYDSSNPNGYTTNEGTVKSVNNTSPDSNGNVAITIPAAQVNSDWNAVSGVAEILNKPNLSTVATSGSYTDLSNKPTIPAAQIQSDWDQSDNTAVDYIKNKPYIPSGVVVDQTYDATSTNAQSGTAVAEAISTVDISEDTKHALKGYNDNGQVLNDATLFDYISDLYTNSSMTGTDVYIGDSFTVNGTLTNNNEVYSGFTQTNNITISTPVIDGTKSYLFRGKFYPKFSSDGNVTQYVLNFNTYATLAQGLYIDWDTNRTSFDIRVGYAGQYGFIGTGTTLLSWTQVYFEIEFDSSNKILYFRYKQNLSDSWQVVSRATGNYVQSFNGTILAGAANRREFQGGIDMSELWIYADNSLVFMPSFSLPYKVGANNSLIADSIYRYRVNGLCDKYGNSPYFTIDTVNENTTLPMPDIYSVLGNKIPDYSSSISIATTPYTVGVGGHYLLFESVTDSATVSINSTQVASVSATGTFAGGIYPVRIGDVITYTGSPVLKILGERGV